MSHDSMIYSTNMDYLCDWAFDVCGLWTNPLTIMERIPVVCVLHVQGVCIRDTMDYITWHILVSPAVYLVILEGSLRLINPTRSLSDPCDVILVTV